MHSKTLQTARDGPTQWWLTAGGGECCFTRPLLLPTVQPHCSRDAREKRFYLQWCWKTIVLYFRLFKTLETTIRRCKITWTLLKDFFSFEVIIRYLFVCSDRTSLGSQKCLSVNSWIVFLARSTIHIISHLVYMKELPICSANGIADLLWSEW